MSPKRYVVQYWRRHGSNPGPQGETEHLRAYSAADAAFQMELKNKGMSVEITVLSVEPYQEKRHGQWRIWEDE